MAEAVVEKEVCLSCGVIRRENTQFCYNCGTPVEEAGFAAGQPDTPDGSPGSNVAADGHLEGLHEKIRTSEEESEKLAKAAAERKKARVTQKRSKQYVWEADDGDTGRLVLLVAVLVAVIAGAIVFVTIRWK